MQNVKRSSADAAWGAENATYLLGQYGDSLLVFSIAKIDAVDSQNGVADVQPSAPVCRLARMDLGN